MVAENKKLTDWEIEPTIEDIINEISISKKDYDYFIARLHKRRGEFSGEKIKFPKDHTGSKYISKLIKKQLAWRFASLEHSLLSNDKMFKAKPRGKSDKKDAEQAEALLAKQFHIDIDRVKLIGKFVRQLAVDGMCYLRIGWRSETKDVEMVEEEFEYVPVTDDQNEFAQMQQMVQSGQMNEKELYDKKLKSSKVIVEEVDVFNGPDIQLVPPEDIMLSPLDDNTICYRFRSTISDLIDTGDYDEDVLIEVMRKHEALRNVNDDDNVGYDSGSEYFSAGTSEKSLAVDEVNYTNPSKTIYNVYEVWTRWDIDDSGKLTPIVATYIGDTIIRLEKNPFPHKKPPFVKFVYEYDVGSELYDEISDIDLLSDNQRVHGALYRGMIDLLGKSANSQIGIQAGSLDALNLKRFFDGKNYMVNQGIDISKAIYTHKFPEIPRSALEMVNSVNNEAEAISGIKGFHSGISGNAFGDVAAGIKSTVDAVSKREESILRRIGRGFQEVARMVLAMSLQNLSEEELLKIVDDTELYLSRDLVENTYDIIFTISTPEQNLKHSEDLVMLLQTLGNTVDIEITKAILSDIAKLKNLPDLADKIENFEPAPNPEAQLDSQLKQMTDEAKAMKDRSAAEYNQALTQYTLSKVGTEVNKAKVLEKDADKRDLEFVERMNGSDVQRQKDLLDHKFHLDLGKGAASTLLNKDTPTPRMEDFRESMVGSENDNNNTVESMTDPEDIGSEAIRR